MKKAELLALVQSLPDDADIHVADMELWDTNDIAGIVPARDYRNWSSQASLDYAVENSIWVLMDH